MSDSQSQMPKQWVASDDFIASLAAALDDAQSDSNTLRDDKSQPPTPDGTGKPVNFAMIAPGLYRSSYPLYAHYEKLADLELKSIVTLVPEPLGFDYENFISSNGIIHHHIPILANKDPKVFSSEETVLKVLNLMLDPANYPMLIHCNKGKHRTGCMTACFRKVTGWTLDACVDEYEFYSKPKDRALDKVFIENFDASILKPLALERGYVGGVYRQPVGDSTKSSVYTNNTLGTSNTSDYDYPINDYQERIKRENDAFMESSRLWSHR